MKPADTTLCHALGKLWIVQKLLKLGGVGATTWEHQLAVGTAHCG